MDVPVAYPETVALFSVAHAQSPKHYPAFSVCEAARPFFFCLGIGPAGRFYMYRGKSSGLRVLLVSHNLLP